MTSRPRRTPLGHHHTAAKSRISDLLPTTIRTTAEDGAVSYWLTHDDTPFAGDFPRHDEDVAVTIDSLYLPDLRLVPTQCSGVQLTPVPAPPSTRSKLRSCRQRQSLRLALSSLGAAAQFQGAALPGFPDDEPTRFRLTGRQNDIAEQTHLAAILKKASADGATILVLPELRVTPAMEGAIQQFLAAGRHSLAHRRRR
ncbi:MAG: hypothetical protein JNK87_08725 [Bryobacterales bacterium]|nr:hypothetical protein [Bryobacterales bacterium]